MTGEEQEKLKQLCQKVAAEMDPGKFLALIRELNDLLESKRQRLEQPSPEHDPNRQS